MLKCLSGSGGGGGGAPTDAEYIVSALNGSLSADRLLVNTTTVTWDFSTASQAKANVTGALLVANNLNDVANVATSRTNLGVTATGADTTYTFRANNLSDVANAATSRTNLGVTATGADTAYAFRSNNLSDLANAGTARTNLGLAALAVLATVGTAQIDNDAVTYAKIQNVTDARLLGRSAGSAGDTQELTVGAGLSLTGGALAASANGLKRSFGIVIDGGGSAITTGIKGDIVIPYTGTITQWTLVADQSGSIVIDVWKDTYANYPPTVADTIAGSEKPTLSTATKNQDTNLTTWATAVTAGDTVRFNVDSVTTVTRATLVVEMTLT